MTLTKSAPAKVGEYGVPVVEDGPKFDGTDVAVENLFNYWNDTRNLYCFLDDFPSVSMEQALEAISERLREDAQEVFHSEEGYVSGMPKFTGCRVPLRSLPDWLAAGYSLDEFLENFPSVSREQAVKTLEIAKLALESIAYETASLENRGDPQARKERPQ